MNARNLKEIDACENEFSEFLFKKIANAGGSIQLQHITGYMSQVRSEIRHAVGTSISDLNQFLAKNKNLFSLENNVVSLANPSVITSSGYDSDNSSIGMQTSLPSIIKEGKGIVVKLFPQYGFIKSKLPIKTEIYFNAGNVGDSDIDLTSFLYTGANVFFNARKKSSNESRSKYNATAVWKADNSKPEDNIVKQKSRKSRETGLYDPLTLDGEGVIQKVFSNLGFIVVGEENNTVFFYKNRVANYDNIVDLTKIFSKGDSVEFNAHRSTKPDAKARWEASKVWKKSGKLKLGSSDNSQCNDEPTVFRESALNVKVKEMKKNEHGKICPRSHGAVIKFGENELADGDSAMYYVCGTQVTDIGWEFSEGDNVIFDAVKIKSPPGWKAVLVWVGIKPDIVLPTCLGDFSEFTDEENAETSSSIYTSKSSSCLSINSNFSSKSESISSKSTDFEKKRKDIAASKKFSNCNKSKIVHNIPEHINFSHESKNSQNWREDGKYFSDKIDSETQNWDDRSSPDADKSSNLNQAISSNHRNVMEREIDNEEEKYLSNYKSSADERSDDEIDDHESSIPDLKNNVDESENSKKKEIASIQKFQGVKGVINKVYSKFAEVKSSNLKSVSFFWKDFYKNGISVEELELDDLKQVLTVGDIIYFNYFIIVDDSGQSWQKVSMAWNGSQPKIRPIQMTPEEFIKQNGLSVTISDKSENQEHTITSRKFLTLCTDENDNTSQTESSTKEDKSFTCDENLKLQHNKLLPQENFKNVSNMIYQALKENVCPIDSKVDLHSISEEILNTILETSDGIKSNDCNILAVESNARINSSICSKCVGNYESNFPKSGLITKDSEVQTIITGEIIAHNVIAEC